MLPAHGDKHMVEQIKQRCGVPASITVYDEEFSQLISDALEEMETAGVPKRLLTDLGQDTNPRVLTAAACYVKAHRGNDRTDTDKYLRMYRDKLHKLMLEPDDEDGSSESYTAGTENQETANGDHNTEVDDVDNSDIPAGDE